MVTFRERDNTFGQNICTLTIPHRLRIGAVVWAWGWGDHGSSHDLNSKRMIDDFIALERVFFFQIELIHKQRSSISIVLSPCNCIYTQLVWSFFFRCRYFKFTFIAIAMVFEIFAAIFVRLRLNVRKLIVSIFSTGYALTLTLKNSRIEYCLCWWWVAAMIIAKQSSQ